MPGILLRLGGDGAGIIGTRMTMRPWTPIYSTHMRGSEATFSPICFMVTMTRAPAYGRAGGDLHGAFLR